MLDKVLASSYVAQDCAFALQHGNFSNWRRDQTKAGAFYLPRKASAGPGGGEYRYLHIIEMGFALALGATRRPLVARQVFAGFLRYMAGNSVLLKNINAMSDEERNALWSMDWGYLDEDHPVLAILDDGREVRDREVSLKWLIARPDLAFSSDVISRDPAKPTHLVYDPYFHKDRISNDIKLIGDMPLSEARVEYFKLRSANWSSANHDTIDEDCDDLAILNLTTLFNRIERRLALRLEASTIRKI